jgi:acyl-CoA synthetase (AMP-forming)/AMP-acid ligase II
MNYDERPWLKCYDPDVPKNIEFPEISLVDRFDQVVERFPRNPALHFLGITLTFEELMGHADRFARALIDHGCEPGDVVGINLPNLPQYLIAQIGTLKAGCATTGVSPLLTSREMAYQLKDCGAKALVTLDAIFENRFVEIADQLPDLKLVAATGITDFLSPLKRVLGRLLKKVPHGKVRPLPGMEVLRFMEILSSYPAERPDVKITPDDHCLIQYTGGTTGVPKGTILTHRNIVSNLIQVETWTKIELGTETALSGFPFFHLAGLAMGLVVLSMGGTQVLIPNPRDVGHMVKEMARYRPSLLVNVPSLYMMLVEDEGFRALDFSNIQFCLSGASPFPGESIRELESITGEGTVLEVYGMTETSPIITMNPRFGKKKVGSVGIPVGNTRVRLVDLETGDEQVKVGEEGELIVQGPQVMERYLNKPEETALTLREHDGETWLHTGDIARMDEDGFFFIVDRAKDMLSVGGFKVFSRELEDKLYEHPAIELCAIVGIPNTKRPGSEIVRLVVQPTREHGHRDGADLKEDILKFCHENFAPYKIPKIIDFVTEIPLTAVGKVDKKALR